MKATEFEKKSEEGIDITTHLDLSKARRPEQEQALQAHLQAIAKILYDDSDPDSMQTLEGIEMTVRQKIQAHVSPELGNFLLERLQQQQQGDSER